MYVYACARVRGFRREAGGNKGDAMELGGEVMRILKPSLFDEVVLERGREFIKSHTMYFVLPVTTAAGVARKFRKTLRVRAFLTSRGEHFADSAVHRKQHRAPQSHTSYTLTSR